MSKRTRGRAIRFDALLRWSTAADGLDHDTGDLVWVAVGRWTTVLEVSVTLVGAFTWNTDRGTTVGDTIGERVDGASLVLAGETEFVIGTVDGDVLLMTLRELLKSSLDELHATWLTHLLGGDVGVETRAVPVTWDWLGVEGDLDAEFFSDTVEEVTGSPEVVTHLDTLAGTDLEFPLGWKDFSVDTRDLDAGVQAGLVVSLDDITAVDVAGTDGAVVWALWTWETALGPAIWPTIGVEEGVLLLKTEPWLLILVGLHDSVALVTVVVLIWGAVWVPGLADDENVWRLANWVWEDSNGSEVDVGVVAWGLSGGRAVEVPFWEVLRARWLLEEGLGLSTDVTNGIDPDVLGHDTTLLVKGGELVQGIGVGDGCRPFRHGECDVI